MASVSEKLQKLINQIEDVAQDEFETLTEAIQALKDGQLGKEFEIWNVDDLIEFAEYVNNGVPEEGIKPMTHLNAKLMANIGDSENLINWTDLGIGTKEKPYQGTFDGQGFNIWLKFHTSNENSYQPGRCFGLFHNIKNAFIKNLTLKGEFTTECTDNTDTYEMTEETGMQVGCLAVNAFTSKIYKCFNEININLQNSTNVKQGFMTYGCAGLITNCLGTHIYQCGNLGDIKLAQITTLNATGVFRPWGGGVTYKICSYDSIGGKVEECFNKGSLSNVLFGGGIASHILGENNLNDEIELINTAKIPLPLTLFGYPDTKQSTVDLDNLVIEHSDNIIVEKHKAPQDSKKYQFIFISTNDTESNGFITVNGITKNIKIIPIEKSIKTSLIKNCYNTGNYGAYYSKRNYSSGILGTTAMETILSNPFYYVINCFDAGDAFFDKSSSKPYTGYSYGPFIFNKRYYQMGIFKNCHTIYNLNYAKLTDLNDAVDSTTNKKWYREKISPQYSVLMEHPHFCDMLDSNVFICANKYPCFRWEYDFSKHGDFSYSKETDYFYIENSLLPSQYFDGTDNLVQEKLVLNKNTNFKKEFSWDNKEKQLYIDTNGVIQDRAFYFNTNLERVDIINATQINIEAFKDCSNLNTLIIRKTNGIISLQDINTFTNGGIKVYVPASLKDNYKSAENWGAFSINSIEGSELLEEFNNGILSEEEYQVAIQNLYNITGGFVL